MRCQLKWYNIRLMANRFRFTISERAAANLEEAREKGNNILVFLKSEGYFAITPGARCRSKDFYNVYERWCQDNLEKPLAAKTFLHYLNEHQQALGIVYDEKCWYEPGIPQCLPDAVCAGQR